MMSAALTPATMPAVPPPSEPLKKLRLLKKIIPYSERKLRDMAAHGELPAVRIGHRYFYRESEIRTWLDGLSERPQGAGLNTG